MWRMDPTGFVSIVEKKEDATRGTLTVRARDARSLREWCKMAEIDPERALEQIETDYPFRLVATREEVEREAVNRVRAIRYDNFKNEANRVRGGVYVKFLGRIWGQGLDLTPKDVEKRVNAKWNAHTARTSSVWGSREEVLDAHDLYGELDEWLAREEKRRGYPEGTIEDVGAMTGEEWSEFLKDFDLDDK